MLTITILARRYGLSRSTLLYYDKIGLLKPSNRTRSNYRVYAESDTKRLEKIIMYRQAGLPLKAIREIISAAGKNALTTTLEHRLTELNEEIRNLRHQQQVVLGLLKTHRVTDLRLPMSKDQWTSLLRSTGLDDHAMHKWHYEFETRLPDAHDDFLLSLGIGKAEIRGIRKWSRTYAERGTGD
ncbi:MAG: MerR family transcriptional regulator [Desulfobacteraceae bacterium]|nr:MerR family transcriptional regulator [Desulfobacteraceae bacterium]